MTIKNIRMSGILFLAFSCFAQALIAQAYEIKQRPREFNRFMSSSTRTNVADNPTADFKALSYTTGLDWMVYSDRGGNKIYESRSTSSTVVKTVELGTALMVTDISSNGWLQVMTKGDQVLGQPTGWIKGIYLVLSNRPLATKERLARKAMVISSGQNVTEQLEQGELSDNVGAVYSRPNTISQNRLRSRRAKTFQIFYVLKETSGAYLLSNVSVAENDMSSSILGWISKRNLTDWNSRVCYAPNFGSDVQSAYPHTLPVTLNEEDLQGYSASKPFFNGISAPSCQFKVSDKEFAFYRPRWPDIGKGRSLGNHKREVLFITGTSMLDKTGEEIATARAEFDSLRTKISQVNLIFVLDATSSMRRYYTSIAESIESVCEATKSWNGNDINLEVSVGCYRDYADENSFEVFQKQQYDKSVFDFINNQVCYSVDPDRSEAMYQGIIQTLDYSGVGKDESNIVILIGDDGNHPNDTKFSRNQVLDKLKEYNAKLYVFQSTARMQAESMKFQEDALFWIDGIKGNSKLSFIEDGLYGLTKKEDEMSLNDAYGKIRTEHTGQGKPTPPKKMEQQVRTEINAWIEDVVDRIALLESIIEGNVDSDKLNCEELIDIFGPETAKALCGKRSDISFSAHTVVRDPNVIEDCLSPYVFLSRNEYNELKTSFKTLSMAGNMAEQKMALSDLLFNIVKGITGGSAANSDQYMNKTLGELWETLFQVELQIEQLRNRKLKDVETLNESDFKDVLKQLSEVADSFANLNVKKYKWKSIRGQDFYWIPAEYFPGFENNK